MGFEFLLGCPKKNWSELQTKVETLARIKANETATTEFGQAFAGSVLRPFRRRMKDRIEGGGCKRC